MKNTTIRKIRLTDPSEKKQVQALLKKEGLTLDQNLDYTCGIFDEADHLLATGSCFKQSLRCIAVETAYQGNGLMNQLITFLLQVQFDRGNSQLFVYTKIERGALFKDLGFYEIARVNEQLVFLENTKNGFATYLATLQKAPLASGKIAGIVLNANPFTLGHQRLIQKAAEENDWLHLFIVSADESLIPYAVRKKLIIAGTKNCQNITYHDTADYLISPATFPSYFLPEKRTVIETQAQLDALLFTQIAQACRITTRYVGTEPTSFVTQIYNQVLAKTLTAAGLELTVTPRFENEGGAISASEVRKLLAQENFAQLTNYVPPTTLSFFQTPEGKPIIQKLQQAGELAHY